MGVSFNLTEGPPFLRHLSDLQRQDITFSLSATQGSLHSTDSPQFEKIMQRSLAICSP